jgi:hypothetical protein
MSFLFVCSHVFQGRCEKYYSRLPCFHALSHRFDSFDHFRARHPPPLQSKNHLQRIHLLEDTKQRLDTVGKELIAERAKFLHFRCLCAPCVGRWRAVLATNVQRMFPNHHSYFSPKTATQISGHFDMFEAMYVKSNQFSLPPRPTIVSESDSFLLFSARMRKVADKQTVAAFEGEVQV